MSGRESSVNPLTFEREPRARFCDGAILLRLSGPEAEAVEFCRARGYLPSVVRLSWHSDGRARAVIMREDAYQWADECEADPHAFCACLSRPLADLFHAADFRIRDGWAV